MKIFVSYSRRDAGDFADSIRQVLNDEGHEVFTDVSNIEIGSVWSSVIENNISDCDIFIAIVTHAALRSPNVEKEVLQAQRENKVIVPCMHKYVMRNQIKWNLTNLQGLEFKTEYDLAREMTRNLSLLYEKTRQKTTRDASNFGRQKQVTTETVGPWLTEKPTQAEEEEEESKFIIKKKGSSPSAKYNKASMEKAGIEALQMLMKEKTKEAARGKTRPSANVPDPQTSKMEDGFWVCRICGVKSLSDEEHEDHYRAVHHFGP